MGEGVAGCASASPHDPNAASMPGGAVGADTAAGGTGGEAGAGELQSADALTGTTPEARACARPTSSPTAAASRTATRIPKAAVEAELVTMGPLILILLFLRIL